MIRRFQALALWLILLLVAALLVVTVGLRSSLGRFQDDLHYRPPQSTEGAGEPLAEDIVIAQTVYVPVYSHVYVHDGKPYPLTATLSIRNTDPHKSFLVKSVRYYDSKGKLVQSYLERPMRLAPLATTEVLVEEGDVRGGSGANFIVEWVSEELVTQPVIEAVMIGATSQQGISFVCSGTVIAETRRDAGAGL
ncbi:MAG: DUF3124 domain-containing protein [Phycisphaerae bacterium]|nr:DUF3124 domain-containing protein [Phycisphaerae bacterium]